MQKLSRRTFIQSAAAVAPTLLLPKRTLGQDAGSIALLHTNDTHSRLEPFDRGPYAGRAGVARRATALKKARSSNLYSLVLDAGDVFQGTPWFNRYHGEMDMKMLQALGYDGMVLGNHEFDAGIEQLRKALGFAPDMKIVSANYEVRGTPLEDRVTPHHIFQKGPYKIGVFGLGIALEGLVNSKMCAGVKYKDPREAAKRHVQLLRERQCDVVVCLSHLGHEGYQGEVGDVDWPKDVPGVDYVVGGHTHTFLEKPHRVSAHKSHWETPVMQVGHSGLWLGTASLRINSRKAQLQSAKNVLV
ncbi:MAG: metallophosphatase [Myxococcales bacterium]|nr:metallophosphatase [Myxococcales bacterium]